jgi:hypothetical protein
MMNIRRICTSLLLAGTFLCASTSLLFAQQTGKERPDDHWNYLNWDGTKWSAKISGNNFIVAPDGDWAKSKTSGQVNYLDGNRAKWSVKLGGTGTAKTEEHAEHSGLIRYVKLAPDSDWSKSHDTDHVNFVAWDGVTTRGTLLADGGFLFEKAGMFQEGRPK